MTPIRVIWSQFVVTSGAKIDHERQDSSRKMVDLKGHAEHSLSKPFNNRANNIKCCTLICHPKHQVCIF
jgi:hypothetical protein